MTRVTKETALIRSRIKLIGEIKPPIEKVDRPCFALSRISCLELYSLFLHFFIVPFSIFHVKNISFMLLHISEVLFLCFIVVHFMNIHVPIPGISVVSNLGLFRRKLT